MHFLSLRRIIVIVFHFCKNRPKFEMREYCRQQSIYRSMCCIIRLLCCVNPFKHIDADTEFNYQERHAQACVLSFRDGQLHDTAHASGKLGKHAFSLRLRIMELCYCRLDLRMLLDFEDQTLSLILNISAV